MRPAHAFRSTLEEAREADWLVHVVDASDPEHEARIEQVQAVLKEIEADHLPVLYVFNKIDLVLGEKPRIERDPEGAPARIYLSAQKGEGLDALRQVLSEVIFTDLFEGEIAVAPQQGKLRGLLFAAHAVQQERVDTKGVSHLTLRLPMARYERICREAGVPMVQAGPALESWEELAPSTPSKRAKQSAA